MLCRKPAHCVYNSYLFQGDGTYIVFHHLDKNSILMDAQHGFRKKHSSKTQLITITEDMACNLTNSAQVDAVFLDFAKAIDKVPHQCHIKLEYFDISSNTLQCVGSFRNNRKQCVIVEGVSSNVVPVTSGVPQDTLLTCLHR